MSTALGGGAGRLGQGEIVLRQCYQQIGAILQTGMLDGLPRAEQPNLSLSVRPR